jgi:hypothetical protein
MRKLILAAATASVAVAVAVANAAGASPSTEHFSLIDASTNASHPVFSAIATGAFTAGGTATETKKPRKEIIIRFPAGTITLIGHSGHSRVNKIQTVTACLQATKQTSGSYTVAGGTGAYRGISGSGKVTRRETFVEAASGGSCANSFLAIQAIITASGPVSLP